MNKQELKMLIIECGGPGVAAALEFAEGNVMLNVTTVNRKCSHHSRY
jgi:hypothetical protein